MKILFVVPYVPSRIRVRPYEFVRALRSRGHDITVGTLWTTAAERDEVGKLGVRVVSRRLGRVRPPLNCLRAVLDDAPYQSAVCWHAGLARDLLAEMRRTAFDIVHVEHLRGARYGRWLKEHGVSVPVVWDSVDCISRLLGDAAAMSRSWRGRVMARVDLARTRRSEPVLTGLFDRTVVSSRSEKDALLALGPPDASRVRVVGNGVDLAYFAPVEDARDPATVVLSGKMSYHANVTAALHLVRDVLPLVWRRRPETRLEIVGHNPPRAVRRLAGARIAVTGSVPDLRPWLRRATVAVAPMPYGVGISNKVLEAMACATPVVASPAAAAALEAASGRELLVGAGEHGVAEGILSLLEEASLRRGVGAAGRAYVERRHDWDLVAGKLEAVYREVCARPATSGAGPRDSA